MSGDDEPTSGLVGPEHAGDGWQARPDAPGWYLYKDFGAGRIGTVWTTPGGCAWQITCDGQLVREASQHDVREARDRADEWVARQQE